MKLISSPSLRKRQDNLPLLLSFFIPFAICCLAFTVVSLLLSQRGLYPFGNDMILAHDGWHQYYPFFFDFRDRLVNGGSLEYTWNIGMGTGYASLFAYYLSSPLNLLCLLVPSDYLPELYAFLTILKISFSGLPYFFRQVEYSPSLWPSYIECHMGDHCRDFFLGYTMRLCILQMIFQRRICNT